MNRASSARKTHARHRLDAWRRDWRHGPTHHRVWALAAPMIASNLTVPLVSLVDSTVAGHLADPQQLGAVAVGSAIYTLPVWMCGFLRMGTTGFAAQAAGRGAGELLRRVLLQSLMLAALLATLVIALMLPLLPWMLALMRPSAALDALATGYVHVRLFGLPAALANYALVGALIGAHRTRSALHMLLVTNLGNIALNLLFVLGLHAGVTGIGAASACGEWMGCLVGLASLRRNLAAWPGHFRLRGLDTLEAWRPLLGVNRDIFLRTLALEAVFFAVTTLGSRLGDTVVAANALLLNGLMLTSFALDGLANAVEALTGHAIGAGDRDALRRALVVAGGWSLLGGLLFAFVFAVGGHLFVDLQTDMPAVRQTAYRSLPFLAVLPLVAVWSYLLDGLFVGATRAREMRDSMLVAALGFAVLALLLVPVAGWGNHGLWVAFLGFMALRGASMGWTARRISQRSGWVAAGG